MLTFTLPDRAPILRHARRYTGNHDDAEDIAQEVLIRAARSSLPDDPRLQRAAVGRMVQQVAADHARRRSRRIAPLSLDAVAGDDPDPLVDQMPDSRPGPEQTIMARTDLETVAAAMRRLDPSDVELLTRTLAGETQADIAASLGVCRTVVTKGLPRARKRLAAAVNDLTKGT